MQESDTDILRGLLEALYLLVVRGDIQGEKEGGGKEGTKVVRGAGTYFVVRELHLGVEDEGVRESCERLVDVLMGDEVEEGRKDGEKRVEDWGEVGDGRDDDDDEEGKIVEIF